MTALARPVLLLTIALLAGSCVASEPEPIASAATAASEFLGAWDDRDYATMLTFFDEASATEWSERDLRRLVRRTLRGGGLSDIEVAASTDVVDPSPSDDPPNVAVPYEVAFVGDAFQGSVTLSGELDLSYISEADRWTLAWDSDALFPGIPDAAGLDLKVEWPARADIVDRDGVKLATGDGLERSYPQGSLAGSYIGHLEPAGASDIESAGAHDRDDLVGASGLEAAYEDVLAGTPTVTLSALDERGRKIELIERQRGERGRKIKATLDVEVQRAAANGLGATVGGAVVIQPRTGDLLAVVTSGDIDPNNYVGVRDISPFNRALSGTYPPGSSLKVMTAAAALDSGTVTPQTTVTGPKEYKGVRNFESGEYGEIPFAAAMQNSVNTAFAQVAEDLGAKALSRYAEMFGFNRSPEMPLAAADPSFPKPLDVSDLMWGSIGQAQVLATPLQMATIAATVANDGVRMEPRSARSDEMARARVFSRKVAGDLTTMMRSVVTGGTGVRANITGASVAGKTGTAEVDVGGERKNHAWFICFAPSENPKIAVAVVAELGGVGGQVAAPIAGNIVQAVLPVAP